MTELIGRNPKYFTRMTSEARINLAAASLAMKAAGWAGGSIGILSKGYDGWLRAGVDYFRDYVAQGRSLGRANLFIYTLPTSAMSEVAIALGLNGPTLHMHDQDQPATTLIQQAKLIIENREADRMLCVWCDGQSAICAAVGAGTTREAIKDLDLEVNTHEVSKRLAERVQTVL